uniref:Uncharacterized protein n=1 Tax=Anguilla anguilla TaxID=7936 RepID=A0A0E9X907_ANGAN
MIFGSSKDTQAYLNSLPPCAPHFLFLWGTYWQKQSFIAERTKILGCVQYFILKLKNQEKKKDYRKLLASSLSLCSFFFVVAFFV